MHKRVLQIDESKNNEYILWTRLLINKSALFSVRVYIQTPDPLVPATSRGPQKQDFFLMHKRVLQIDE